LGFKYVGPIDGHDIPHLISIFKRVKNNMVGPVLIHVVTQKGKGYPPAEQDASLFHGIGSFDAQSGKAPCSAKRSYSEVFGDTMCELARQNPKIVAITAAMSAGTGLSNFEKQYPERFFDVGIAEQHAVTLAAGMATKGIKPFVAIYSTFMQRALDQMIHDVALPRLPVVFCLDRAGIVGEDGATHQGAFDIAFLHYIPNLTILAPSCQEELLSMLSWASEYQDGPVVIRYPRGTARCRKLEPFSFRPGKAELILPESPGKGPQIALIAAGDTLALAEECSEILRSQAGLHPVIVNLRSLKPLDLDTLVALGKSCSHLFSFESGSVQGGIGAEIGRLLAQYPAQVINFGYPDSFIPHGSTTWLNEQIGFTPAALAEQIITILKP
ncbi:MAG TPA: transketolase C-terminal domain-containing protein, partial [Candidatus Cloacimonadota bacterium]|nr:transketolase C-terminal domain-containing protein [Candidatus Cloacimonadota bacterium]